MAGRWVVATLPISGSLLAGWVYIAIGAREMALLVLVYHKSTGECDEEKAPKEFILEEGAPGESKEESFREVDEMLPREAACLAVALTFSNIAAGLAAGAMGLDVPTTVLATFVASMVFMQAGQRLGTALRHGAKRICRSTHRDVSAVAACFFIAYGLAILLS